MTVHHRIAAIAVVAVAAVVWGAGSANAGEVTLRYQCSLPPFPAQGMTLRLTWDSPDSVPVGQHTPAVPVSGIATMGAAVTQVLGVIGASTVEGSLDATGVVVSPEGTLHVVLPVTVPRTDVPASGPITVAGRGTTPVFVFHRPGHAMVTADSGFTVHIVPRDASGDLTIAGRLDASCALDPGQDNVLNSFEITAPRTPPPPTTGAPVTRSAAAAPTTVTTAPETASPSMTATHGVALATGSITRRDRVDPRLAGGGILAGTGFLGCVWWLKRRRRRGGHGH